MNFVICVILALASIGKVTAAAKPSSAEASAVAQASAFNQEQHGQQQVFDKPNNFYQPEHRAQYYRNPEYGSDTSALYPVPGARQKTYNHPRHVANNGYQGYDQGDSSNVFAQAFAQAGAESNRDAEFRFPTGGHAANAQHVVGGTQPESNVYRYPEQRDTGPKEIVNYGQNEEITNAYSPSQGHIAQTLYARRNGDTGFKEHDFGQIEGLPDAYNFPDQGNVAPAHYSRRHGDTRNGVFHFPQNDETAETHAFARSDVDSYPIDTYPQINVYHNPREDASDITQDTFSPVQSESLSNTRIIHVPVNSDAVKVKIIHVPDLSDTSNILRIIEQSRLTPSQILVPESDNAQPIYPETINSGDFSSIPEGPLSHSSSVISNQPNQPSSPIIVHPSDVPSVILAQPTPSSLIIPAQPNESSSPITAHPDDVSSVNPEQLGNLKSVIAAQLTPSASVISAQDNESSSPIIAHPSDVPSVIPDQLGDSKSVITAQPTPSPLVIPAQPNESSSPIIAPPDDVSSVNPDKPGDLKSVIPAQPNESSSPIIGHPIDVPSDIPDQLHDLKSVIASQPKPSPIVIPAQPNESSLPIIAHSSESSPADANQPCDSSSDIPAQSKESSPIVATADSSSVNTQSSDTSSADEPCESSSNTESADSSANASNVDNSGLNTEASSDASILQSEDTTDCPLSDEPSDSLTEDATNLNNDQVNSELDDTSLLNIDADNVPVPASPLFGSSTSNIINLPIILKPIDILLSIIYKWYQSHIGKLFEQPAADVPAAAILPSLSGPASDDNCTAT